MCSAPVRPSQPTPIARVIPTQTLSSLLLSQPQAAWEPLGTAAARGAALVHESKMARHRPNHRCFTGRWRRSLAGPCRSSYSGCCTRATLRPFAH